MKRDACMPMDTGWSWVVLIAAFLCHTILFGTFLCYGIYAVTFQEYFQCSKRDVALLGCIKFGFGFIFAPITSIIYKWFGCRATIMSGGLISMFGMLLSYFATSISWLNWTYGVVVGIGYGLVFPPTMAILPDYFDRYQNFATAFVPVGSAVGSLSFSPLFLRIIDVYSWRGSMLIQAGLTLQIVLLGSLLKDRRQPAKQISVKSLLDIGLLSDLRFILFCITVALWAAGIYLAFSMLNDLVIAHGLSREMSTGVVVAMGIGNALGRVLASFVSHRLQRNHLVYYGATMVCAGIMGALIVICWSVWNVVLCSLICGLFLGQTVSLYVPVLINLFGVASVVSGVGYTLLAHGICGALLPIVSGLLADAYSIEVGYLFGVLANAVGGLIALAMYLYDRLQQHANDTKPRRLQITSPDLVSDCKEATTSNAEV